MEQLSALDAAFVYLESPRTPMHIGGVYLIDRGEAGPDFDERRVRLHVASRLQVARTFRQRLIEVPLTLGHPFWIEDPDFSLEAHLSKYQLPAPGGKRELMELAGGIFAQPLDRERPLWDMAYVAGLDSYPGMSRDSVAIISRVHHAAIDGVSGAEIMGALLDPAPDVNRNLPPDGWQAERIPGGVELVARSYGKLGAKSIELARVMGSTARGASRLVRRAFEDSIDKPALPLRAPRTPLNTAVTERRSFGGVEFQLSRIKALRSTVPDVTVNDVLLAVCAGALRGWLERRDALPERSLVAMVPMSVRTASQRRDLGNRVSAMLVGLATEIDDPHLRLATIRRSTRGAKNSGKALPANRLMDFVPSETAALASRLYTGLRISDRHPPLFNLVITNVPGPRIPLYMGGAAIRGHLGTAPVFDGLGLLLVIFSLGEHLSIGITACREIMSDVAEFEELLNDAVADLEQTPVVAPELLELPHPKSRRRPDIEALHLASERLGASIDHLRANLEEEE